MNGYEIKELNENGYLENNVYKIRLYGSLDSNNKPGLLNVNGVDRMVYAVKLENNYEGYNCYYDLISNRYIYSFECLDKSSNNLDLTYINAVKCNSNETDEYLKKSYNFNINDYKKALDSTKEAYSISRYASQTTGRENEICNIISKIVFKDISLEEGKKLLNELNNKNNNDVKKEENKEEKNEFSITTSIVSSDNENSDNKTNDNKNSDNKDKKRKNKIRNLVIGNLIFAILGGTGIYHLIKNVKNCGGSQSIDTMPNNIIDDGFDDDLVQVVTISSNKDTLWYLCKQIYGDGNYYAAVCEYNDISNYRHLRVGDEVRFPSRRVLDEIRRNGKSR